MRKIAILAVAFALLGASTHMASAHSAPPNSTHNTHAVSKTVAAITPAPAPAPIAPQPTVVEVQPGDTLSGIADSQATTYMRLYNANDFITDPNLIYPGEQVRIPLADEQLADRAAPVAVAQPAPVATEPAPETAPAPEQAAPVAADPAPAAPVAESAPAPAPAPAPVAAAPVSDNAAKAYIYAHESSNNPNATNEIGCYGLGQDCNGIVRDQCGADYACQDEFFTRYAMNRYGSWDNALAFWQNNHWW